LAPVIAGPRLRAGRANSAKGAARMVAQAISTARAISADTTILVRGDSAFGSRAVVGTCIRHRAQFSVAMARNSTIDKTIGDRLDPGPEQRPEDVGLLCQRLQHCRRSRRRETNRWDRWPRRGLNRWRDPDRTNTESAMPAVANLFPKAVMVEFPYPLAVCGRDTLIVAPPRHPLSVSVVRPTVRAALRPTGVLDLCPRGPSHSQVSRAH